MKRSFLVTTLSLFTLLLSAVDSRLELPKISKQELTSYQYMQSDNQRDRNAGLATLVEQDSELLSKLHIIEDRNGDLLYKQFSPCLLKDRKNYYLHTGKFVVLHEGDELPQEFYPCIILGRTVRPTREELKTLYMPYTFLDHDDKHRSEGSDDATSGDESQAEEEDESPIDSLVSEDEQQKQNETMVSTEDKEIEPEPYSRKRKRNADAAKRARKRIAVVRRSSVTIPCEIGTETLVTRVSKNKCKVQVWPLV